MDRRALDLLEADRAAVVALAGALMERRLVSGDALRTLIAEATDGRVAHAGGQA